MSERASGGRFGKSIISRVDDPFSLLLCAFSISFSIIIIIIIRFDSSLPTDLLLIRTWYWGLLLREGSTKGYLSVTASSAHIYLVSIILEIKVLEPSSQITRS